jgi:hypothetical protein
MVSEEDSPETKFGLGAKTELQATWGPDRAMLIMLKSNLNLFRIFKKHIDNLSKHVIESILQDSINCQCGYSISDIGNTSRAIELLSLVDQIDEGYISEQPRSFARVLGYTFNSHSNSYVWNVCCLSCRAYSENLDELHSKLFIKHHEYTCAQGILELKNVA